MASEFLKGFYSCFFTNTIEIGTQLVRDKSMPARTSIQPAVVLIAPSISLMTVLPGLIMSKDDDDIAFI